MFGWIEGLRGGEGGWEDETRPQIVSVVALDLWSLLYSFLLVFFFGFFFVNLLHSRCSVSPSFSHRAKDPSGTNFARLPVLEGLHLPFPSSSPLSN